MFLALIASTQCSVIRDERLCPPGFDCRHSDQAFEMGRHRQPWERICELHGPTSNCPVYLKNLGRSIGPGLENETREVTK